MHHHYHAQTRHKLPECVIYTQHINLGNNSQAKIKANSHKQVKPTPYFPVCSDTNNCLSNNFFLHDFLVVLTSTFHTFTYTLPPTPNALSELVEETRFITDTSATFSWLLAAIVARLAASNTKICL